MEKKTNRIKKIELILFFGIIFLLIIFTIYKLNKKHEEKLYDVLYSQIKYEAKKCFLKKECESNITLKELYEKNYLEILYDPITKEELSSDMKIIIKDDNVKIK